MPTDYSATQGQYTAIKTPCIYCLLGKCAERKAAGLCHCGDHATEGSDKPWLGAEPRAKESPLAETN